MTFPTVGSDRFDDAFLDGLRLVGDPGADTVVAEYIDGELEAHAGQLMAALIAHGSESNEESAPLRDFVGTEPDWPDWGDRDAVRRGQDIFATHVPQLGLGLWMASIPAGYAGAHGAEVLTHTARLVSDAKRRFLETGQFILDVMTHGGLQPGGSGLSDIRHVRLMHASARHLLQHSDIPDQPPFDVETFGVPINQEDLLGTLFTFSLVGLQVLDRSGVRMSAADKEAYVHTWNVIGHGMGIRDDLLPLDFNDSSIVFARIRQRAYARSEAGALLTAAAIEVMQELLRLRVLRGIPAAGIREYLGDEVADLLRVPPAGISKLFFIPDRWFNKLACKMERDSRVARKVSEWLGRRVFRGFLEIERQGEHRPNFELSDALAEQLKLR